MSEGTGGMRLCGETVTVFNARLDGDTGRYVYMPTVIAGCGWHRGQRMSLDAKGGLAAAEETVVRIPVDADFGGRRYADPISWQQSDGTDRFTLKGGDLVARGAWTGGDWTPARLKAACPECFTVLGVTDNSRAPRGAHWKLVGA